MKSKLKSFCQKCGEEINVGDEISRIGNGLWAHDSCKDKKVKPNITSTQSNFHEKLLESKKQRTKSLKCINCGGINFLKSKYETNVLDDGEVLTKKLYICYTCAYIMQFVEKLA